MAPKNGQERKERDELLNQLIVKRNRKVKKLIKNYVKNMVVPFIKDNTDEDEQDLVFLIPDVFKREYRRLLNITFSMKDRLKSERDLKMISKKFVDSRNVQYSIEYADENGKIVDGMITPQNLHKVGSFTFNYNKQDIITNSTNIVINVEFFGKFEEKMTKLMNVYGECRIDLDIKFSLYHPNKILQPFWEFKEDGLKDYEYNIQLFHDIDNVLFFQIDTTKGFLTGVLDPLNGKLRANFFESMIQVEDNQMKKIKKMQFL